MRTTRPIKYIGWNTITKTLLDLKAITPLAMSSTLMQDGVFIPFAEEVILMEFIGAKDCEGADIYEDYVVEGDPDGGFSVVTWNESQAAFGIVKNKVFLYPGADTYTWNKLKIVGIIHRK